MHHTRVDVRRSRLLAATLLTMMFAACGGGGGGAAPTMPGAPRSAAATAGNAQATVTFLAPASDGGSAITGYTVVSNPVGGTDSQSGGISLSHVVTGLSNGTAYTFIVIAINSVGTGPASAPSNSVTPAAPTVPGAPVIGTATPGDAQVRVAFTAPASNGGAAITSYTATCGVVSASGPTSPITVAGLTNGNAYTCTVLATNSVGNGPPSAASNSVTPQAPPPMGALNDTGQSQCLGDASLAACTSGNAGDTSSRPRQDARFGRDALATAGQLTKTGSGPAGFDFTLMCMSGDLAGTGACAATPPTPTDQAAATANQWACTRDNHTGLVWSMQTTVDSWANATTALPVAANSANRCGFGSGWRLPTRRELLSIVNNGTANPTIATGLFTAAPGTLSANYWSSDTDAALPTAAWAVAFTTGTSSPADKATGATSGGLTARLVHGPVTPAAQLTINGDGTATDSTTGLTWDRCSYGQSNATCDGTPTNFTWPLALTIAVTANGANYKGHNDWRLPSKNELESLIDIGKTVEPLVDTVIFPNTPAHSIYWTSTPYAGVGGSVWYMFFDHPLISFGTSSSLYSVRLVRGGAGQVSFDGL